MRKVYRFIPLLVIFFILNSLSVYAKLLNPLTYIHHKKSSKVTKAKKASLNVTKAKKTSLKSAKAKKTSTHKKLITKNKHKKHSKAISKNDTELKVSTLLPEEASFDYIAPAKNVTYTAEVRDEIIKEIVDWYDTRYKWGGKSRKGIDCSGFTSMIYENVLGLVIPRSSREQF